jgi:1-deoxy-D-xylulose-5-phosphate reductoisomerase
VGIDDVKVIVHPQSVIHSMVKFKDGSVLGQLGWPNMRLPIQYALLYPERKPNELLAWSPLDHPHLTFEALDEETFRSPKLARQSSKAGGTMPCAMNAANEEAANAFLRGEVGFLQIPEVVERTMARHQPVEVTLESLLEVDAWAREEARRAMSDLSD